MLKDVSARGSGLGGSSRKLKRAGSYPRSKRFTGGGSKKGGGYGSPGRMSNGNSSGGDDEKKKVGRQ
jgi:hypothetical protein